MLALTLIFCGLSIAGLAYEPEKVLGLRGNWKFAIGDNPKWADPNYDDSDWERIYVPSEWEDEGFRGYNGYAWYRTTFDLEQLGNQQSLYLVLGRIDDVDEVYLNGELIGSSGSFHPGYFTAYNVERRYSIPKDLLKRHDNLIAVRVFDEGGPGGILGRNVGIYGYDNPIPPQLTLYGHWKFQIGDNMDWKEEDYDDSGWDGITVPGIWENQGYWNYDGFAWYRKNVMIPETLSGHQVVLLLGKIDDLDEVYINGELIGSTGRMYEHGGRISGDEWQEFRGYYVPRGVLRSGVENLIAVRVYDGRGDGGIHEGPVGILEKEDYEDFWQEKYKTYRPWWSYFESW